MPTVRAPAPGELVPVATTTVDGRTSSARHGGAFASIGVRLRTFLPQGGALPSEMWEARHRVILVIAWAHAVGLAAFGLYRGWGPAYSLGEGALIALIALAASWPGMGRRFRASTAAFALSTSSAVLVQFSGGYIEAHFHYFVIVAVIALYQDWVPFLMAIAYVALDHGVIGSIAPMWVYNHAAAIAQPWAWAGIHAALVLAECMALLILWRSAEDAQRVAIQQKVEIGRLTERDQLKSSLITTMSHELKTPLTSLRLQAGILEKERAGPLNERQMRSVHVLSRNLDRLGALVDQTLDVGRLEAGRLRIQPRAVPLDRLVTDAVEAFEATATEKGIALRMGTLPETRVEADLDRVTQVVANLLSNAIKFTPAGGTIEIEAECVGATAVVRVRDSGEGIESSRASELFKPFSQVHDTMEKSEAGSGLGLYISRGIIEEHGGRVWFESAGPGRGSTFAFTLPLAAGNAA